jgi:HD superfamily phosphohydrolase YqeK
MEQDLKIRLGMSINKKRIPHAKTTADTAMIILDAYEHRYGKTDINRDDLYAACILHDCSKELDEETHIKVVIWGLKNGCDFFLDEINRVEYSDEIWLHGISSAIIANQVYGLTNVEALRAIRYHKIPTLEDSLYVRILYVADIANDLRTAYDMRLAYKYLKFTDYDLDDTFKYIYSWQRDEYHKKCYTIPARYNINDNYIDDFDYYLNVDLSMVGCDE